MRAVAIDLETTGLDPMKHEMIEFAAVGEDEGEPIGTSFSVPFDVERADPKALEINQYRERLADGRMAPLKTHAAAIYAISGVIEIHTVVVASPAHFDMGFLGTYWMKYANTRPPWGHRRIVDLKSFACGLIDLPFGVANTEISEALGIEDTSDHTATADAAWTWRMFKELVSRRPE